VKPGKRDEFMDIAIRYSATTLELEDGIEFLEFHPASTDPNTVIVIEKYRTPEDHDLHHKTEHFERMWEQVQQHCVEVRFENIFADRVEPDFIRFATN
jgi:quinol monooxygenase YgiN